jgi:hypothetical protein
MFLAGVETLQGDIERVRKSRDQLSLVQILQAYHARSNLEHFFRFGIQKLLLTDSQTPVTVREER